MTDILFVGQQEMGFARPQLAASRKLLWIQRGMLGISGGDGGIRTLDTSNPGMAV